MAPPQRAGLGRPNLSAMKKNDTPHPSTVRHTLERSALGSSQVTGFRTNDARDESARRARLATTLSGGINKTAPGRALLSSTYRHPLISQATARVALGDQFNHLTPSNNRRIGPVDTEGDVQELPRQSETERTRKLRQNLEAAIRYLRRSGGTIPPAYLQTRPQDPVQPTSGDPKPIEHVRIVAPSPDVEVAPVIPMPGNAEPNTVPYTISEDFSDQQRIRTQEMKLLALKDRQEIPIRSSIM
ncbi:hypothetical protein F4679DRAFT_583517 [Xylaria curta]|nr:hypothetical protein F4679DRAFT_583517 [Xylaria curta]